MQARAYSHRGDRSTVIESQLGPPQARKGYERQMFPAVQVGLKGWHRAHSQGGGTGHESRHGILYAPPEVNQQYQRLGVEDKLSTIYQQRAPGVEFKLTTVTRRHTGTSRLREIEYKVEAVKDGQATRVWEASIEVENKKVNPKVSAEARSYADVEQFLRRPEHARKMAASRDQSTVLSNRRVQKIEVSKHKDGQKATVTNAKGQMESKTIARKGARYGVKVEQGRGKKAEQPPKTSRLPKSRAPSNAKKATAPGPESTQESKKSSGARQSTRSAKPAKPRAPGKTKKAAAPGPKPAKGQKKSSGAAKPRRSMR